MSTTPSSTESRALTLLGQGLPVSVVANALGVSDSAISQLLSNPSFAQEVKNRKFAALARHNTIDENYDKMETALQKKLHEVIPMMFKPRDILHALQVVNSAKRRGMPSQEATPDQSRVVPLIIPTIISQKFVTNINQQVIQAGQQDLTTLQSSQVSKLIEAHHEQLALPSPDSIPIESGTRSPEGSDSARAVS